MKYIPELDDIDPDEIAYAAIERVGIAEATHQSAERLSNLLLTGTGDIKDAVDAAKAELMALCELRMLILTPKAQDSLEDVLERKVDFRKGAAVTKAAEIVFDRGAFPKKKVGSGQSDRQREEQDAVIPKLDDLIKGQESSDEILEIVRKQREAFQIVDELRHGARQIIDVVPTKREKTARNGSDPQ